MLKFSKVLYHLFLSVYISISIFNLKICQQQLYADAINVDSNGVNPFEEYSDPFARYAVTYASIAMQDPAHVKEWAFQNQYCNDITEGFELAGTYFTKDTAFGLVGVNHADETIVVSFKASNDTADWAKNLDTGLLHYRHDCIVEGSNLGKVHKGFCKYYTELAEQGINDKIVEMYLKYQYPIVFFAHSLGAAASTIAAADMKSTLGIETRMTLYLFGLPRVGDYDFGMKWFNNEYTSFFRVVHSHDLVPHVAWCCTKKSVCQTDPACPFHFGSEIWYEEKDMSQTSTYTSCESMEDPTCSDSEFNSSTDDHTHYFNTNMAPLCRTPGSEATLILGNGQNYKQDMISDYVQGV